MGAEISTTGNSIEQELAARPLAALVAAVSAWLAELDASQRTQETYKKAVASYVRWVQDEHKRGTTRADLLDYKRALEEKYKATTVNTYLVPVRRFFAWLAATTSSTNPAADIRGARIARGFRKEVLTVNQAKEILCSHGGNELIELRDSAIIALMLHTGVRTIEVCRANVEDFHSQNGVMILAVQGKGHAAKDDFVVIPALVEQRIRKYLKERGDTEPGSPLFASVSNRNTGGRMATRSISRIAKETLKEAGLDDDRLTAHSYRHTAITNALLAGATVQEAQAMARHANINTTMIYAHNIDRLNNAAENKLAELLAS